MSNPSELLQRAVQHHRSGDLVRAEQLYAEVLEIEPQHATAHHLLGMAAMARRDPAKAAEHFARAVDCDPGPLDYRHHLGLALDAAGQSAQAVTVLRDALARAPERAALHNDLGTALRHSGQVDQGESHYRQAVSLDPSLAEAHNNLGNALHDRKQYTEAIACFQRALQLSPQSAEANFNLANTYRQLGEWTQAESAFRRVIALAPSLALAHRGLAATLFAQRRYAESVESYRQSLRLSGADVDALVGLGQALQELQRTSEAIDCFRQALAIKPDDVLARQSLGGSLSWLGDYPQAEVELRQVIERSSHDAELYFRLGHCQLFQGNYEPAIASFGSALADYPDNAEYHYYRAAAWLASGDFQRGWPEYEWRLKTRYAGPPYRQPRWDGRALHGQRILLHCEWGFGDTLHFLRYVPLVCERGGQVWLEVQPGLIPLLETSGYTNVVPKFGGQTPQDIEWQAPLLSLPGIFQTTLETIPVDVPYLKASPAHVEKWRKRLGLTRRLRVGIHWHGSKAWETDPRSIPLAEFAPLADVRDVELVSLQKHDEANQIAEFGPRWSIVDFGDELDASGGAFMDTAALMTLVDLVITCDTGTAHVAGALGVPTWVALPRASEWRWMWNRDDSPWYPSLRLFRQPRPFDWQTPFAHMASELAALAAARADRDS